MGYYSKFVGNFQFPNGLTVDQRNGLVEWFKCRFGGACGFDVNNRFVVSELYW